MTINAILGQGAKIYMGDDSTGTGGVQIAETTSISGPTMSNDQVDVTTHDSVGGFREKIAGLTDPGELSFDILYRPGLAEHAALLTAFSTKAKKFFQLVFPSSPEVVWMFEGTIVNFEGDLPVDDAIKASISISISGLPDFDATEWVIA